MKILQINKFFYRHGGADHHFLDLIELLKNNEQKVLTFSMKDKKNFFSPEKKYFVSNADFSKVNFKNLFSVGRIIYSLEAKNKLNLLIQKTKPEIAHLHLIYHHLSPSILVALKKNKIPTIMTIHDWKILCPAYSLFTKGQVCERCRGGKYIECYKNRCIKNSSLASLIGSIESYFHHFKKYYENYIDLLIAPSNFVKNKFIYFGWPAEKIRVLPHFLSDSIVKIGYTPSLPQEKRFAYIGRLSEEKGIYLLVDWWIKNNIPHTLDIYGDGPLKNILEDKVKQNKLQSRIVFYGNLTRNNVYTNLNNTTAVIVPSVVWETFGLTVIETFARGLPVIATAKGGLLELIEKSGAGLLFDWDKNDLKEALEKSHNLDYRKKAIEYMRSHHLSKDYYEQLMNIYKEIK